MTRSALQILAILAFAAAPLAAQPPRVRVSAGARVRVTAPPRAGWIAGTIVAADSERVVLRDGEHYRTRSSSRRCKRST